MVELQERFHSTVDKYEAKDFSYFFKSLDGITEKLLNKHYGLYEGYINKTNEILEKIKIANINTANHNYSEMRELLVELSHNLNAVILHELYFSNLIDRETAPTEALKQILNRDFGSWENYINHIRATAKSARGWAITAYNYRDGKIHNFAIDGHNLNVPISVKPLLVIDVWEHAYALDYGTNKNDYIEAFFNNVNWPVVSTRLDAALKSCENCE